MTYGMVSLKNYRYTWLVEMSDLKEIGWLQIFKDLE